MNAYQPSGVFNPNSRAARMLRIAELCQTSGRMFWRGTPDLLRAEHALREALQIIETLRGESHENGN